MRLKYLGTAAAEGFPAIFCNCKYCNEARVLGGKNIRTRSQSLINSDLLIDLPADTYHHILENGIRADEIKYLLITHGHADHLYARELGRRRRPFAHNMSCPRLKMICSETIARDLQLYGGEVDVTVIKAFETVELK